MRFSQGSTLARGVFAAGVAAFVAFQPLAVSAGITILDPLQATVKSAAIPWMDNSLQLATGLFSIMMTVTFITALMRYVALNHTIEGFGHCFMDLFMKVIPLYVLMASATTLLPNLVDIGNQLSNQITGGHPVNGPDEILDIGGTLVGQILGNASHPFRANGLQLLGAAVTGDPALFLDAATLIVACMASVVLMGAFVMIAFEYFFCFVQAFVTLSIGAISLGWLASPGTKNMGEVYLGACWTSLMRIVLTVACVSFIVTITPNMNAFATETDPNLMMMTYFKLASAAAFAALLAWKVPAFATNMFSAHPAVTAMNVATSAPGTAAGNAAGDASKSAAKAIGKFARKIA
jgi:hypothetical protein